MKKRAKLLSVLLTLVMVLGLVPTMSIPAVAAPLSDGITVNGTVVTSENAGNVLPGGNSGKVKYFSSTDTLIISGSLVDADGEMTSTVIQGSGATNVQIDGSDGPVARNLTISGAKDVTVAADCSAPGINGAAKITCSGNVSITNSSGYAVGGSLTVSGAKDVTVTGNTTGPIVIGSAKITCSGNVAITNEGTGFALAGSLTASGAKDVTVTAISGSPTVTGDVTIDCTGNVVIKNGGTSMAVTGSLSVEGAKDVTVIADTFEGPAVRGTTDISCSGVIAISDNTTYVSNVTITDLDALVHGQAADYNASTSTPGCTVEKVEYQMFRKILTDYVPSDGDNVAVVVTVSAADGYAFASGSTATWNGLTSDDTAAGLNANEKRYAFYIKVGADESQIVRSAAMTVTPPEIGKAPSTAVTGSGVEASSVKWSPADATFQAGKAYTVSFTLKADAAHVLADDFATAGSVTVNGQKAALTSSVKGKFVTYTVSFTFPALTAAVSDIAAVSVTGIDVPVIGARPDTTALAGSGNYTVAAVNWEPADGTFAAGKAYAVTVSLEAKDGFRFAASPAVTVNGQTAKVISGAGSQEMKISYTFPALTLGAPVITRQPKAVTARPGEDVTFTVAAAGEALNYQWWMVGKNGAAAKVGTNGPSYTIKAVNAADDDGTKYYCVVSNKAGEVTSNKAGLTVSETVVTPTPTFIDVPVGAYFFYPVEWAVDLGITNGTTAATFSPHNTCTRAQIITFLWRANGCPEPKGACPFTDIPAGAYFEKATAWAAEQGMAGGTKFGPYDPCTRLMAVEFMWKQAGCPKAPAAAFTDVTSDAVNWAVNQGVTNGTTAATFAPGTTCTRAQIVTFLWRAFAE
ncbi:S-layer homology domain-containing protein [Dysosmobacter sp.]|uniref:S-layer homology domain-containing protein n=1 Tax=Dysosmobacter sp. TaxID=2591382 RepID=UPI002A88B162|nr:S-layer homology domain-containing protein [Dysosmobacter sp.]MDY3281253.1 S-layer homology domain-containing protein [Dysosmobacter sp.]